MTVSTDRGEQRFSLLNLQITWHQRIPSVIGILVDKDDLINYQLLIIYQLLIRTFTYQPTVDKWKSLSTVGRLMIVDKVWKSTNTGRVGLDARSSHTERQSTFPDSVCSYCPPCHGMLHYENLTTFLFFWKKNSIPKTVGEPLKFIRSDFKTDRNLDFDIEKTNLLGKGPTTEHVFNLTKHFLDTDLPEIEHHFTRDMSTTEGIEVLVSPVN